MTAYTHKGRLFAGLFVLALATGCNGAQSTMSPATNRTSMPISNSGSTIHATLTFEIPAPSMSRVHMRHALRRAYVSPGSLGAVVSVGSLGAEAAGESFGYDLSANGVCVASDAGSKTCTLPIALFAGSYQITIELYDAGEAASPNAPVGNALSIDTERETVTTGVDNNLDNFLLHGIVQYFVSGNGTFGASGNGSASQIVSTRFEAQDADTFGVDRYGNATTYANGPFVATETDFGDVSNCDGACLSATNDAGSTFTNTASVAAFGDTSFQLTYSGAGGPGTGVTASVAGSAPASQSQRPYYGQILLPASKGSGLAVVSPLFAYPTSVKIIDAQTAYLWAAQAMIPQTGNAYSAYFSAPGVSVCQNSSGATIATIGHGTLYAGYGEVYPITPGVAGSCTLSLSDGASPADIVNVPVTVTSTGSTITVPCAGQVGSPTMIRRRFAQAPTTVPSLVQFATGVEGVTLPSPVQAGNTLVLIVGDDEGRPSVANFDPVASVDDNDPNMSVYTHPVANSGAFPTVLANDGCNTSMWLGEFAGTDESVIDMANANSGQSSGTTPSIVPDAYNGLLLGGLASASDTMAATAQPGYTEFFRHGVTTSLDVELSNEPTTDSTNPVNITFGSVPYGTDALILQIPPIDYVRASPAPQ